MLRQLALTTGVIKSEVIDRVGVTGFRPLPLPHHR